MSEQLDDELVFTGARGDRINQSYAMRTMLKPTAAKAGVGTFEVTERGTMRADSWVGWHTFRHTAASLLFNECGWNAVQVSKFLGHTDPGFTLRTYVHLLDEDMPRPDFPTAAGAPGGQEKGKPSIPDRAKSAGLN